MAIRKVAAKTRAPVQSAAARALKKYKATMAETLKEVKPPVEVKVKKRTPRVRLNFSNHGGGCCGMSHLSSFGATLTGNWYTHIDGGERRLEYVEDVANDLVKLVRTRSQRRTGCAEVVLTDDQMTQDDYLWHKALLKAGFVRVTRFLNSNSDNYCNIYHGPYGQPKAVRADPLVIDFKE